MSSRGRGFGSRGGGGGGGGNYRGRGGGDWGGSSGNSNRGGFSLSRGGRCNKYNSGGGYDSRNKYNSSGGSDRYGSRGGRGDHSNNYKRQRDQTYSSRDDHRSSSETNRKRPRNDSYQGEGSSSSTRYSSSYGGGGSSYDNKRSSSSAVYDDKRQSDRQSSYHRNDERHSSASRNNYSAPPPPRISDMAPPPTSQKYNSSSNSGSNNNINNNRGRVSHQNQNYRGRPSTRARGNSFRSRNELLSRKRNITSTLDYRRKLLTSRSRDYIQRVRMSTKLRRSGASRISGSKKESGSGIKEKDKDLAKAINAEFSDDDEEEKNPEENWDEEEKGQMNQEEEEDIKERKPKEDKRKKEKSERQANEDEEEEKSEEKEEGVEAKPGIEEDNEEEPDDKPEATELESVKKDGKRITKLQCPHCSHRSTTFKDYLLHLYSGRHNAAMRRIAARHKANITRMRVVQRQEQRKLEAREALRGTLPSRTMFCQICKLNYRSMKAVHHLSDAHRQMKKFLTPFCKVCKIKFRSAMLYETHTASLDHIKALFRKNSDEGKEENGDVDAESSAGEDDDKEVNLDNFMTLDSVGDVDAEEDEESSEKKKKDKSEGETSATATSESEPKKAKTKQMIKVGAEYIKKIDVQFCELCKVYLPRNENIERAIALHCSTRSHLKRYVRDNDDKALRRQAERIHLQSSSNANKSTESTSTNETSNEDTIAQQNSEKELNAEASTETAQTEQNQTTTEPQSNDQLKANEDEEEDEYPRDCGDCGDKSWDDVDKDIGDILREVEPGSDDENSRYDRFRNSDKKKIGKDGEPMENDEKCEVTIKVEVEK